MESLTPFWLLLSQALQPVLLLQEDWTVRVREFYLKFFFPRTGKDPDSKSADIHNVSFSLVVSMLCLLLSTTVSAFYLKPSCFKQCSLPSPFIYSLHVLLCSFIIASCHLLLEFSKGWIQVHSWRILVETEKLQLGAPCLKNLCSRVYASLQSRMGGEAKLELSQWQ